MRRIHRLKVESEFFEALASGEKRFEVRKNDRDFNEGDFLVLDEWDPTRGYTRWDRCLCRVVTYLVRGGRFGIEADHVVMGIDSVDRPIANVVMALAVPRESRPHG